MTSEDSLRILLRPSLFRLLSKTGVIVIVCAFSRFAGEGTVLITGFANIGLLSTDGGWVESSRHSFHGVDMYFCRDHFVRTLL
jgi:hypothetical protein